MKVRGLFFLEEEIGRRNDTTKQTLKNAIIVSQSGGGEMYEITLTCPMKDVSGEICEVLGLEVEIRRKENGHRD